MFPLAFDKTNELAAIPDSVLLSALMVLFVSVAVPFPVVKPFTPLALLLRAVITPLPVVIVEGATPAPPPTTKAFAAKAAEVAQVDALLKYGMPPEVPAIVNAGVDVGFATVTMPPVQLTDDTVPEEVLGVYASQAVPPTLMRTDCPAEGVTLVKVFKTFATGIDSAGIVVFPVPPLATATVPVTFAAVPVVFWLNVGQVYVPVLKSPDVGVPRAGVTNVGDVAKTKAPEPVSSVTAEARLADDGVARKVATPVPSPDTPVEIGSPVAFVSVADRGVPRVGVTRVGLFDRTTEPVPVAVLKSVRPDSQLAAVVPETRIQVHITVVPGNTVMTKLPPDELTVTLPVLLLTMWNVQPVSKVLVTGKVTVWVVVPVNCW
jgi:hypothetical protein